MTGPWVSRKGNLCALFLFWIHMHAYGYIPGYFQKPILFWSLHCFRDWKTNCMTFSMFLMYKIVAQISGGRIWVTVRPVQKSFRSSFEHYRPNVGSKSTKGKQNECSNRMQIFCKQSQCTNARWNEQTMAKKATRHLNFAKTQDIHVYAIDRIWLLNF